MLNNNPKYFTVIIHVIYKHNLHATELEAVGISLVMGGKVVVVENPDAEHSRVHASTQEKDGDETRHLVEKTLKTI